MVNNPITYFFRLLLIIFATLVSLRILFVLVARLPGVVLALSIIAIGVFTVVYRKGGWHAIGIRSRKASLLVIIASFILLVVSAAILINVNIG